MSRSTFSARPRSGSLVVGALAMLAITGLPLFGDDNGEATAPPGAAGGGQAPSVDQFAAFGAPQQGAVAPDQNRQQGAIAPDQNRQQGAIAPDQNRQQGVVGPGQNRGQGAAMRSQNRRPGGVMPGQNRALDNRFRGNATGDLRGRMGTGFGVQPPGMIGGRAVRGATSQQTLGRDVRFRSLSPIELQQAIDALLSNRREQIQSYYEMRELRDRSVDDQRDRITSEQAKELAQAKAPDRLSQKHFYEMTGKLYWPEPLDAEVLTPYTAPIDEKFQKRADAKTEYTAEDAAVVQRMLGLLQEAVETLEDDLDPQDYSRLTRYLDRVSYESRFNAQGERVDLPEDRNSDDKQTSKGQRQGGRDGAGGDDASDRASTRIEI